MQNIQPFIDLGFHTVPLQGELKRLEDGTKTTPMFETNWKNTYQNVFNESATALGGVITGAISNIVAIDCDDQVTYDLFRSLDTKNTFHFVSKGKPKGGGTIIYRYPTGKGLESFSIQSNILHLDFYADNGFVYLPSRANQTKERWEYSSFEDLPDLHQIPDTVLTLLYSLQRQYTLEHQKSVKDPNATIVHRSSYLAPQIELFCAQKKFIPALFRIITPKDFRALEQYAKLGYLHPDHVPEGRGSEYLSKVSAILGADPSVSKELYLETIDLINNMWDSPIQRKRLMSTIVDPMLEGKASINGEAIWAYDEHWKSRGISFTSKLGDAIEVFFDDVRASYYMVNYTKDMIKQFYKDSDLFGYIEPIATALPVRKDLKTMCPVVRTKLKPSLPFGFYSKDEYNREFNLFRQSPALSIITDPKPYKELYNRPETILKFLETFIPDTYMRNYVLGFLKRKFTTFKYSPVLLYFLGVHGSGKDTFVSILGQIIGVQYIARPSAKEFLDQFNGWLPDKYFVQLDEYGNQLHTLSDKEIALGKIKSYTGKPEVQIRQMRTDGYPMKHHTTFIMTANSNPLLLEDGDRRACMIDTPNVLKDAEWVKEAGGTTAVINQIELEINDFAYFLATEVDSISPDFYMSPPETEQKRDLIASKLPAAHRLAYYFKHGMFEQLEELCEDANTPDVLAYASDARVHEDDLMDLYTYMTEARGSARGLAKVMKENDFDKVPTTKNGKKLYYYSISSLYHFKAKTPFKEQEEVIIDGV